jgi:NAD(P)-dependent dehydrogenase (short-subunit alcohol dehydrogenase family)
LTDFPVDVLVHVAGRGSFDRWGQFDYAQMLADYDLNALGPLRTICALESNLQPGAKVGIVTSRMASIGDNGSGRMYGYRMSKAAANMLGVNLYHQLEPADVRVMLLHPGTVATAMTQGAPNWDEYTKPAEAAAGLVAQMDRLGPDTPPEFRHADGTLLPW